MKMRILSAALKLCLMPFTQPADSAGVTVYASEITQMLNNIQLGAQYLKQVQMVLNEIKMLEQWAKSLKELDSSRVEAILRGQFGISSMDELNEIIRNSQSLANTLDELRGDVVTINYEQQIAASTMQRLRDRGYTVSADDYVGAIHALSREQVGGYADRYKRFSDSLQSAQHHISRASQLASEAPAIQGQVEGLAALNAGHAQMQVQLAELSGTLAATGQLSAMEASRDESQRLRDEAQNKGQVDAIIYLLRGHTQ